jgi:3D (Asp-Asp-Asp) domain-containing protein
MIENTQMTALTKATLKDSNSMKNIAVLTTVFLPGTYIAVSPHSLHKFSKEAYV